MTWGTQTVDCESFVANFYGGAQGQVQDIFIAQFHLIYKVCNTRIAAVRKEYIIYKRG